ncbi:MAG TPA: hypothetical protein VN708_22310, partial [Terriglobales bacterium]|nr:hypothetical protein [Terriglobales bacterium]
ARTHKAVVPVEPSFSQGSISNSGWMRRYGLLDLGIHWRVHHRPDYHQLRHLTKELGEPLREVLAKFTSS